MEITLDAEIAVMEMSDFEKVVSRFIQNEMYQAVREFLKACVARIPVDTGFLRGSFQDILTFYRVKGLSFTPNTNKVKRYFHSPGFGIIKTPTSGRQFVTPPQEVIQRTGPFSAAFEINNMIKYFAENDVGSSIPSAPWGAVQAGINAANEYLQEYAKRFPKIEALLSTFVVRVRGSTISKNIIKPDLGEVISRGELLFER